MSYNKSERGFAKHNKNAKFEKNLMEHHIVRLYMMTEEEKGRFISYEEAIEEINGKDKKE